MVTTEQDPAYFRWASDILKVEFVPGTGCKALTNLSADGRVLGVVIYSRFTARNCEMSVASDGSGHWMTREYLRATFGYPFVQCKLQRVMAVVEANNARALALDLRLGFVQEGRLRDWFPDQDGLLLGMLRSECRYA